MTQREKLQAELIEKAKKFQDEFDKLHHESWNLSRAGVAVIMADFAISQFQEGLEEDTNHFFQVVCNGNKTDIYWDGKLIKPDYQYGIPLTMDQCKQLSKIQEDYHKSLQEGDEEVSYPASFVKWLIDEQECFLGELSERYIINDNPGNANTIDELYEYWKSRKP